MERPLGRILLVLLRNLTNVCVRSTGWRQTIGVGRCARGSPLQIAAKTYSGVWWRSAALLKSEYFET